MSVINSSFGGGGGIKVNGQPMTVDAQSTVTNGDLGIIKKGLSLYKSLSVSLNVMTSNTVACYPITETLLAIIYRVSGSSGSYNWNVAVAELNTDGSLKNTGTPTTVRSTSNEYESASITPITNNTFIMYDEGRYAVWVSVSTSSKLITAKTMSGANSHYDLTIQKIDESRVANFYHLVRNSTYTREISIYNYNSGTYSTPVVVETYSGGVYYAGYDSQALSPIRNGIAIAASKASNYLNNISTRVIRFSGDNITVSSAKNNNYMSHGNEETNTYILPCANLQAIGINIAVFVGNDMYSNPTSSRDPLLCVPYSNSGNMQSIIRKEEVNDIQCVPIGENSILVSCDRPSWECKQLLFLDEEHIVEINDGTSFGSANGNPTIVYYEQAPYLTFARASSSTTVRVQLYRIGNKMIPTDKLACISTQSGTNDINVLA